MILLIQIRVEYFIGIKFLFKGIIKIANPMALKNKILNILLRP